MSPSINRVTLQGTVALPPRWSRLPGGATVCHVMLATEEHAYDWNSGRLALVTVRHRVVLGGASALRLRDTLAQGAVLRVHGCLEYRRWTGRDGVNRTATSVVATAVRLRHGPVKTQPVAVAVPASMDDPAIAAWVADYAAGTARAAITPPRKAFGRSGAGRRVANLVQPRQRTAR